MKRVEQVYGWLLILPVVLPLLYVDGVMYPMLAPKTLALRALGVIALALFVYLKLSSSAFYFDRVRKWETWVPAALLATAYLSSYFGLDFYHSFWSTYERGDGLLTLTVCVGYFYLLLVSADETLWQRLLRVVAWVGSLAGAYVIVQWFFVSLGLDLSPLIAKANGRVGGTMGNAAFLAAYLGMTFFVTLAVAREYRSRLRQVLYGGAALQLVGIVLAATRGTMLALCIVGVGIILYEAFCGTGARKRLVVRIGVGVVLFFALFFMLRDTLSQVPFEPVRRMASISLSDGTVSSRLFLWESLLPEALKSPVLGVGGEHVDVLFNRVYDPTRIAEEWFDRSHNAYLDYLIQYGVVGLVLYLALLATILFTLWRFKHVSGQKEWGGRIAPFLFLSVLTYALQNFFVFDTGVTLWLLLALAALVFAAGSVAPKRGLAIPHALRYGGVVVGAGLLLLLIPVFVQPARANRLAFSAYLYHVADVAKTSAATEKGLALNTYADLEFGYNAYFMYTDQQFSMLKGAELTNAYETARRVLAKNFEHYPYDARTGVYLIHILNAAPEGVVVDRVFQTNTIAKVLELSPKRPEAWYMLANLAIEEAGTKSGAEKAALYEAAAKTLAEYISRVPEFAEPRFVLADLKRALGDKAGALAEAERAKEFYRSDLTTARRAAVFYEKIGDWVHAEYFLTEVVKEDPQAHAWRYDLAKAKYINGDTAGAAEIVRYLRSADPAILATDPAFMAAIAPHE